MNLFKSAVICFAVFATCGCEKEQHAATVTEKDPPPTTTNNPKPVELPESAASIGMEFKLIPAGTFTMGEGDSAHEVTLTRPFYIGIHEVTRAQYEKVMGMIPSGLERGSNPVIMTTWHGAVDFCHRLNRLPAEQAAGNVYRLPTEAEWEYACRAGTTTKYSFGDDPEDYRQIWQYAWIEGNSNGTQPVGKKKPNPWGLYDMHGNALEWCQDRYGKYPIGAVTNPTGPASGSSRVFRGGMAGIPSNYCGSATRGGNSPSYNGAGLRLCLITQEIQQKRTSSKSSSVGAEKQGGVATELP